MTTTIQVDKETKRKLAEKKKELKLANVGAVVDKLLPYLDKIKG